MKSFRGAVSLALPFCLAATGQVWAETLYNNVTTPAQFPPYYTSYSNIFPAGPKLPESEVMPYYMTTPPTPILIDIGRQLFVDTKVDGSGAITHSFMLDPDPAKTTVSVVYHR